MSLGMVDLSSEPPILFPHQPWHSQTMALLPFSEQGGRSPPDPSLPAHVWK